MPSMPISKCNVSDTERIQGELVGISDDLMVLEEEYKEASDEGWEWWPLATIARGFDRVARWLLRRVEPRSVSMFPSPGEFENKRRRLTEYDIPFVDLEQPMAVLFKCFSEKETRAINKYGPTWPIPIVDAPCGMDKARLGYAIVDIVKKNKAKFLSLSESLVPGLIDSISDAVTITVTFREGELAESPYKFQDIVLQHFKKELDLPEIQEFPEYMGPSMFMRKLQREWKRPIMICFDEVASACRIPGDTTIEWDRVFHLFTEEILVPLGENEEVFVIVCGNDEMLHRDFLRCRFESSYVLKAVRFRRNSHRDGAMSGTTGT
jgi:hypothetical protein